MTADRPDLLGLLPMFWAERVAAIAESLRSEGVPAEAAFDRALVACREVDPCAGSVTDAGSGSVSRAVFGRVQRMVLDHLREHGVASARQMAGASGLREDRVRKALRAIQQRGEVVVDHREAGQGKGTNFWRLT